MKVAHHVAASCIAAAATWAASRSLPMAGVVLASGVLVDLDHALDYVLLNRPPYSVAGCLRIFYQGRLERVFVVLHAWELFLLLAAATGFSGWHPLPGGLLIGIGHHLVLDQLYNRPHPLGYFLLFRLLTAFAYRRSFPKGGLEEARPGRDANTG